MKKSTIVLFCFMLQLLAGAACAPHIHAHELLPLDGDWRTLRAEQKVTLDVTRGDGTHEHRTLRAVIAVERPDRFRLRALGPGGLTLFDLVAVGGRVTVIESLRDPASAGLGEILTALAGDVAAAYDLEPKKHDRAISVESGYRVVRETDRTVRVSGAHIVIENRARRYTVTIDSIGQELNVPLDPALFADAPR